MTKTLTLTYLSEFHLDILLSLIKDYRVVIVGLAGFPQGLENLEK